MCLALRDGPRGFRPGFTCPNVLRCLSGERRFSRTGLSPSAALFPADSANLRLPRELSWFALKGPSTPAWQRPVLDTMRVWAVPVSLATTQGIEISFFSPATKMFQFADLPLPVLCVQTGVSAKADGFPHSEISGSKPAGDSPELNAANHVLLRHSMPRHPPCALGSLTIPISCVS